MTVTILIALLVGISLECAILYVMLRKPKQKKTTVHIIKDKPNDETVPPKAPKHRSVIALTPEWEYDRSKEYENDSYR